MEKNKKENFSQINEELEESRDENNPQIKDKRKREEHIAPASSDMINNTGLDDSTSAFDADAATG
jgi:hypothetical protein